MKITSKKYLYKHLVKRFKKFLRLFVIELLLNKEINLVVN
jgi:hypothetical protein